MIRVAAAFALLLPVAALAAPPAPPPTEPLAAASPPAETAKPDPLVIYFDSGSANVPEKGLSVLDHASRLYRDGNPIVMIISGSTDSVGSPGRNLLLSQQRDQAVLRGLVARGIPTERFQLLAKGETDPHVANAKGVAEPENRRVEITWR
jgi:outer membrane protein OmpA-like peptidoglycan-associated protein